MSKNYIKIVHKGGAEENHKAVAQMRTHDDTKVIGYIQFEQTSNGKTHISGELEGLPTGEHGMHIHTKGDSRQCCSKLGDHYNPYNLSHGDRTSVNRHVGDMGNITFDENGKCKFEFDDDLIKISRQFSVTCKCSSFTLANSPCSCFTSVIGRSIIIHENKDDLGKTTHTDSKTTGNSGKRIAYGIIGYA